MIPDACPTCDPLTHPASLPGSLGVYECPSGHRWSTTRDVFGWPIERTVELRDAEAAQWPTPRRAA